MPRPSIELYVHALPEADAVAWLDTVLDDLTATRTAPLATYEGTHDDTPVVVQIAEHVEGGAHTHLWIRSDALPWSSTADCAKAAFAATERPVLCYPDHNEDAPWRMLRVDADGAHRVDERDVTF